MFTRKKNNYFNSGFSRRQQQEPEPEPEPVKIPSNLNGGKFVEDEPPREIIGRRKKVPKQKGKGKMKKVVFEESFDEEEDDNLSEKAIAKLRKSIAKKLRVKRIISQLNR